MADNLNVTLNKTGDGTTIATINGKIYTLLAGYEHWKAGGWFFLAVAGRTPLKPDDLDKHWAVARSGPVTIAYAQRLFSYHLSQGEGAEVPYGVDWPKLKSPPERYAFVGVTDGAVRHQVALALDQYRPDLDLDRVLERAIRVHDEAGAGPQALLIHM
jgi:hypothetical protein